MTETNKESTMSGAKVACIIFAMLAILFTIVNVNVIRGQLMLGVGFSLSKAMQMIAPCLILVFFLGLKKRFSPLYFIPLVMPLLSSIAGVVSAASVIVDVLILLAGVSFVVKKYNFGVALAFAVVVPLLVLTLTVLCVYPFGLSLTYSGVSASIQLFSAFLFDLCLLLCVAFAVRDISLKRDADSVDVTDGQPAVTGPTQVVREITNQDNIQ